MNDKQLTDAITRITARLADIEVRQKAVNQWDWGKADVAQLCVEDVPRLCRAVEFLLGHLGPCICDSHHQFTCDLCDALPVVADILEGKS